MTTGYFWLIIIIFIGTFFFGIQIILKYSNKKILSDEQKEYFKEKLKKISKNNISLKEKIIDCDKIYHKILLELGYEGSFGEILKKEPNEVGDLDKIWKLHKLRNKLVHEFEDINKKILSKKFHDYKKEIEFLGNF